MGCAAPGNLARAYDAAGHAPTATTSAASGRSRRVLDVGDAAHRRSFPQPALRTTSLFTRVRRWAVIGIFDVIP